MWDEMEGVVGIQVLISDAHFHLSMFRKSTQLPTQQQIKTAVTFGTNLQSNMLETGVLTITAKCCVD